MVVGRKVNSPLARRILASLIRSRLDETSSPRMPFAVHRRAAADHQARPVFEVSSGKWPGARDREVVGHERSAVDARIAIHQVERPFVGFVIDQERGSGRQLDCRIDGR